MDQRIGNAKPLPPRVIGFSMLVSAVLCALIQGLLQEEWNGWLFFTFLAFGSLLSWLAVVLVIYINKVGLNQPGGLHLPPE